jgi:hypothetical protein
LHIIFDKYLDRLAAHGRPAFQRLMDPASRGTVSAENHTPNLPRKSAEYKSLFASLALPSVRIKVEPNRANATDAKTIVHPSANRAGFDSAPTGWF